MSLCIRWKTLKTICSDRLKQSHMPTKNDLQTKKNYVTSDLIEQYVEVDTIRIATQSKNFLGEQEDVKNPKIRFIVTKMENAEMGVTPAQNDRTL